MYATSPLITYVTSSCIPRGRTPQSKSPPAEYNKYDGSRFFCMASTSGESHALRTWLRDDGERTFPARGDCGVAVSPTGDESMASTSSES